MAVDVAAPPPLPSGSQAERALEATVGLAEALRRDFRDRDDLYREINMVIFNEYPVDIPEAYKKTSLQVQTNLPLEIVNQAAAALSVNPVSVLFRPIGFGDVHMQNATAREHFFEAAWERQQQEARRRLLRAFIYSLVSKGEGILKTLERNQTVWGDYYRQARELDGELRKATYDDDARDRLYDQHTEQLKAALPYPITTTDVPPESFYYTKNENGFTSCVEIKSLPYYECLSRWGVRLDDYGRIRQPDDYRYFDPRALGLARPDEENDDGFVRTDQSISCIEAWDWQKQYVVLIGPGDVSSRSGSFGNGTLVRMKEHHYGDPVLKTLRGPYFHALGVTTDSRMPARSGLSILFGYLRLFPLLNSLLTMQANAAYMTAFPAFKRTLPPGAIPGIPESSLPYGKDGSEQASREEIVPGEIYPYDIAAIDMPRAGTDAEKLIGNIQQMLERAMPDVVKGTISGDQSGYAINQAAHLARLAWDPIVSNAQTALGERTGFESWLIENRIAEKVYAWGERRQKGRQPSAPTKAGWLGIGPEDLKGIHRYEVRLDPETPSNRVIETRAVIEQMNARLITYEDAVTEMGSNPDEVELSWMAQDYKKSPEIRALVNQMVNQKVATITAGKMAALGMPPGMGLGTPPGPPVPNLNQAGAPAPNPVPMPGAGMPLAPPPPGIGGPAMPPGGIPIGAPGMPPGTPVQPNPPANFVPLPGQ